MNAKFVAILVLAGLLAAGITIYTSQSPEDAAREDDARTAELPLRVPVPEADAVSATSPIDFSLAGLDGNTRHLSDWAGKARLVNFWATWCAPCRREIPLLKSTQETHGANNLQIIGIAVEDVEPVLAYAEEAEFNYPILVGQDDAIEAAAASGVEFIGLPFTIVFAPDGQMLKAHTGEIHESHIETIVAVFEQLAAGDIDVDGARTALRDL